MHRFKTINTFSTKRDTPSKHNIKHIYTMEIDETQDLVVLNHELVGIIFQYLDLLSLSKCYYVSRIWKKVIDSNVKYEFLFQQQVEYQNEHLIFMSETWKLNDDTDISFRQQFSIRSMCLQRVHETLFNFVATMLLNTQYDHSLHFSQEEIPFTNNWWHFYDKNAMIGKETEQDVLLKRCKKFREWIGWYQMEAEEQYQLLQQLLKETENYGVKEQFPLKEYKRNELMITYAGALCGSVQFEVNVRKQKPCLIIIEDVFWNSSSVEEQTASIGFVDDFRFAKRK